VGHGEGGTAVRETSLARVSHGTGDKNKKNVPNTLNTRAFTAPAVPGYSNTVALRCVLGGLPNRDAPGERRGDLVGEKSGTHGYASQSRRVRWGIGAASRPAGAQRPRSEGGGAFGRERGGGLTRHLDDRVRLAGITSEEYGDAVRGDEVRHLSLLRTRTRGLPEVRAGGQAKAKKGKAVSERSWSRAFGEWRNSRSQTRCDQTAEARGAQEGRGDPPRRGRGATQVVGNQRCGWPLCG